MTYKLSQLKTGLILIAACMLNAGAYADSFCGYDENLIGTKAIGDVRPYQVDMHEYKVGGYDEKGYITSRDALCAVKAYDAPSEDLTPEILPCADFMHVPSEYVGNDSDRNLNISSEYYAFLAFDAADGWAELALNEGGKKWVKSKNKRGFDLPYHYISDDAQVTGLLSHPTQSLIFTAPDLKTRHPYFGDYKRTIGARWLRGVVPADFFDHPIFELLESYGLYDPKKLKSGVLPDYHELLELTYEVTSIVKDHEGREWLKAEEYLGLSLVFLTDRIEYASGKEGNVFSQEQRQAIRALGSEQHKSTSLGTVYFPYREPSGTITMVMTDGPDCD